MNPREQRVTFGIISIDLDNVISNTDLVIRRLIETQYGIVVKRNQIKTWNYSESVLISAKQEEMIFSLFHRHFCLYAPVLQYAAKAINLLSRNFRIYLVTARPTESDQLTRSWLDRKKIHYDNLIYSNKKAETGIDFAFVVEDNGETAFQFANKGIPVILLSRPWNKDYRHSCIFRVGGWKAALHLIETSSTFNSKEVCAPLA